MKASCVPAFSLPPPPPSAFAACDRDTTPVEPTSAPSFAVDETGNGAPSGAHFNLNIIGVPKAKKADMTGDNGRRIFVGLGRDGEAANTKILLGEGPFQVGDANGTDGTASFYLPNPDPDGDGVTAYSVYVRALGKPGGKAMMQTCYDDFQTGETKNERHIVLFAHGEIQTPQITTDLRQSQWFDNRIRWSPCCPDAPGAHPCPMPAHKVKQ